MDNQVSKDSEDRWINERLASLNPPANWQPHADRAFEKVMQRQSNGRRQKWIRLTMAGAAFASAGVLVAMLPWNTLWTPKTDEPVHKALPVEARQEAVPAFAAEIHVAPASLPRDVMGKASTFSEELVFKPIPPLPELTPTQAELYSQATGSKKTTLPGRELLAETAARGPQELTQGEVSQPVVISKVQPVYTEEAKQAKIRGIVELVCTIHTDGSVTVDQIARGLGYGLDESARDAVSQWKFVPGKKDGLPVSTVVNIVVNFGLK